MVEKIPSYLSWKESKCPYTKIKTRILLLFNKILWSDKNFSIEYGIKKLWLSNSKHSFDITYSNLNKSDLLLCLKNWWNLESYLNENWLEVDIIKRMIEREFSVLVFTEFYEHVNDLTLDDFQMWDSLIEDILSNRFTLILEAILDKNLNDTLIWKLTSYINWEEYPRNENFNISWRLYHLFMDDSIYFTIKLVISHIEKIRDSWVKINKALILDCFKNSSKYFKGRAVSNQPMYYFNWWKNIKIDSFYDVNNNEFYFWNKEKDFDEVLIYNDSNKPDFLRDEYLWCPVLFTKLPFWDSSYNWILAYQLKIADLVCDLNWL